MVDFHNRVPYAEVENIPKCIICFLGLNVHLQYFAMMLNFSNIVFASR